MSDTADIRVGDIVSWEGPDAHEVISISGPADQFPIRVEVRCVRAAAGFLQDGQDMPDPPWAKIGDINWLGSDEVDLISRT